MAPDIGPGDPRVVFGPRTSQRLGWVEKPPSFFGAAAPLPGAAWPPPGATTFRHDFPRRAERAEFNQFR